MGTRYAELILDSGFSDESTGTYIDNKLSVNRPLRNLTGIALHKARIPLTFDTIFAPNNFIKWEFQSLPNASPASTVGRDRGDDGIIFSGRRPLYDVDAVSRVAFPENKNAVRIFANGTPGATITDQYNYFTQSGFVGQTWTADTFVETIPGDTYSYTSPAAQIFLAPLYVKNLTQHFADGNLTLVNADFFVWGELVQNATSFSLRVRVVSQYSLSMAGAVMKIQYPVYLARRLGLPVSGTWTIDLGALTGTITTAPGVGTGGPYPLVQINTFIIPFPFAVELQLNKTLILRGNLAPETQSTVYTNDPVQDDSDVVAVVPIEGTAGGVEYYTTPNQEIFSLPRPLTLNYVRLYFTRGEDSTNTPVVFKGFDYWLKFACQVSDENGVVEAAADNGTFISSAVKRMRSS